MDLLLMADEDPINVSNPSHRLNHMELQPGEVSEVGGGGESKRHVDKAVSKHSPNDAQESRRSSRLGGKRGNIGSERWFWARARRLGIRSRCGNCGGRRL